MNRTASVTAMRNGPIFINGFSRGGTTMLANILASHPDICYLGETHHIFKGHRHTDSNLKILWKSLTRDLPAIVRQREDVFSPRLIRERRPLSAPVVNRFRRRLVAEKKSAERHAMYSKYKSPGNPYASCELAKTRLMSKNVDGMIFSTNLLVAAFPDATFVGLFRDGFALCEGHLRRGRSAEESGWRYRKLSEKIFADAERLPAYHLYKFEDLIADPIHVAKDLYTAVGLDPAKVSQIRMQRRRVMDADGNHRLAGSGPEWGVEWLDWNELSRYCQPDVNQNQIARLSELDREQFLTQARETMVRLGYLPGPASSDRVGDTPICAIKTRCGSRDSIATLSGTEAAVAGPQRRTA